ncbi:MAG: hypothetical protein IJ811_04395 [Clostridia bacterium]|nr:hypothetical protein [Clostridia bacterium]
MKKSLLFKIIFTLAVLALTVVSPVTAFAEDNDLTFNDDRTQITYNQQTYNVHSLPFGYGLTDYYRHYIQKNFFGYDVYSTDQNDSILIEDRYSNDFYTTDAYWETLQKYFSGEEGLFYLQEYHYMRSYFDFSALANEFNEAYGAQPLTEVQVQTLDLMQKHSLNFLDTTRAFYREYGIFFTSADNQTVYYVELDRLPNTAFDANGALSFRNGSINVYPLTDEQRDRFLEACEEMTYYETYNDYRSGLPTYERRFNYFPMVIFGILLPLFIFVWSLVIIIKKRHQAYARVYIANIASAVWFVTQVILLILLLL